jgi:hypothetical protein
VSSSWQLFNDTNACAGSPLACSNTTAPFVCLGTAAGAAACAAAAAAGGAAQWTWSPNTHHCWTRTDGTWAPTAFEGFVAGCDDSRIAACAPPPPPPPPTTSLTAAVGAVAVGRTHALHPAVGLDFWHFDDPAFGAKWGNASALTIDLASPALRAAAAALAPAILRLGGSPEDSLVFDADGTCVPRSGGAGPFPSYYCSQVSPYVYDCLTRARWAALLEFAAATGLKVAFGLNGCWGRPAADAPMDLSNAGALFEATAASPHAAALWGFELSNEVAGDKISPAAWAADAAALKAAAAAAFGAAGLPPPLLVGPDQVCCVTQEAVAKAVVPGVLAALTYHQYANCEAGSGAAFVLAPACLADIDAVAGWAGAIAAHGSAAPLAAWMGEGAEHAGGGVAGLTDTFRSSFYVAWLLGASAAAGVELTARQTLSGGDYELLQHGAGFAPNPDFWVHWLFKALVGGGVDVFNVTATAPAASGVRVFAFAAAAATGARHALLAVNLQLQAAVSVTLQGGGVAGAARTEFHLAGNLTARHGEVVCNGVALALDPSSLAPPPWRSLGAPAPAGSPLVLAPATIALVLV